MIYWAAIKDNGHSEVRGEKHIYATMCPDKALSSKLTILYKGPKLLLKSDRGLFSGDMIISNFFFFRCKFFVIRLYYFFTLK